LLLSFAQKQTKKKLSGFYSTSPAVTNFPAGSSEWFVYVIVFVLCGGVIGAAILLAIFLRRPLKSAWVKRDQESETHKRNAGDLQVDDVSEDLGVNLVY
jgi:hypothetical protein